MAYSILPRLLLFSNTLTVLLLLCALISLYTYADVDALLAQTALGQEGLAGLGGGAAGSHAVQLARWLDTATGITVLLSLAGLGIAAYIWFGPLRELRETFETAAAHIGTLPSGPVLARAGAGTSRELGSLMAVLEPLQELLAERRRLLEESKQAEHTVKAAETRLFHALDSISEGFSLYDSEDRLVLSNGRYREMIYPHIGHLIRNGMTFTQTTQVTLDHEQVSAAVGRTGEWLADRLEIHRNPAGPFLQHQTDGRWLQINERKMLDGSTVAVYEDVSELMHREEALAAANRDKDAALAERNAVLDAIDYAVLFMDSSLDVRIANRAYREMWDIPDSFHPAGTRMNLRDYYQRTRPFYDVSDEAWEEFLGPRVEAIRLGVTDPPVSYRANGSVLRRSCHILPDGGRMLTYFDITELTRAEAAQREGREQAETAALMKSQFVATMSHELRTPLNAIIGLTDMLIEESDEQADEEVLEPLGRITQAGKHLLRLIDDILDLSTMEAGHLRMVREPVDLAALCHEAGTTVRSIAEANGNTLRITCEPAIAAIESDATRLRQVVLNLLGNACKFTQNGEISLSLRQHETHLELAISDTGIGMDADRLEDYFAPFSQGDSSTNRRYGGVGLGLTISRKICELLGAELTGHSEPGSGTTFTVKLPA